MPYGAVRPYGTLPSTGVAAIIAPRCRVLVRAALSLQKKRLQAALPFQRRCFHRRDMEKEMNGASARPELNEKKRKVPRLEESSSSLLATCVVACVLLTLFLVVMIIRPYQKTLVQVDVITEKKPIIIVGGGIGGIAVAVALQQKGYEESISYTSYATIICFSIMKLSEEALFARD